MKALNLGLGGPQENTESTTNPIAELISVLGKNRASTAHRTCLAATRLAKLTYALRQQGDVSRGNRLEKTAYAVGTGTATEIII